MPEAPDTLEEQAPPAEEAAPQRALRELNDLAARLLQLNTAPEIYAAALDGILPIVGAAAGAIEQFDDERRLATLVAQQGEFWARARGTAPLPYDDFPPALAAARTTGDLAIFHPTEGVFAGAGRVPAAAGTGVVVPILRGNRTGGALVCLLAEYRDCTPLEREILRTAATYVGAALERARLYDEAAAQRDRLAHILTALPVGVYIAEGEAATRSMRWNFINAAGRQPLIGPTLAPGARPEGFRVTHLDNTPYTEDDLPMQQTLWTGQPVAQQEMLIHHHTGEEQVVLVASSVLREEQGTREAVVVTQDITERKRAEQQLQQRIAQLESLYRLSETAMRAAPAEQIYQVALDGLQQTLLADRAAVLLFDPDGVMRFKAWRGLTDDYRRAAEGHSPWTADAQDPQPVFVPDVDEEPSLAALRPVIRGAGIRALGFIPLVAGGRLLGKFMLYYDTPHVFTADEAQLALTFASQVAWAGARKRAEEERSRLLAQLEQERQRLATIVANVPGVVWEAWGRPDAANQRIDFVSDYVEMMLGYSVAEWLATPNFWLTIVHPADKEAAAATANAQFASGEGGINRFRWLRKDGSAIWVESHATVIKDAAGAPLGMRGVSMDVSERLQLEDQTRRQAAVIQEEYERLATLIATVDVALALLDAEGRVQLVNDTWVRRRAYQREEVLGRRFEEFVDPDHAPRLQAIIDQALATGEPALLREFPLDNWQASLTGYVDWSILPIRGPDGTITGLLTASTDVTEKVQARQEIEDQRARLATIIQSTPLGIVFFDHELRAIDYNLAWAEMAGIDHSGPRGWRLFERFPPTENVRAVYERALSGEAIDRENVLYQHPVDGTPHYYDVSHRPISTADGTVIGVLATSVDVTEQVRARQEIERQHALLEMIVEGTPVGTTFYDQEMRLVNYNSAWAEMLGQDPTPLLGRPIYALTPTTEGHGAIYERVLAGESIDREDVPYEHPLDGTVHYYDIRHRPIRAADGTITGVLTTSLDVTEQAQARQEIERQRALLEMIVEVTPVGIAFFDREMRVLNLNTMYAWIAGFEPDAIRGRVFYELRPDNLERQPHHERALAGEAVDQDNVPFQPPDADRMHYYDVRYRPVRDATGQVTGFLSALVDVTARYELERQKDEFLSIASHELKTPVTTIKGYAQAGQRVLRNAGDERLVRTLRIIDEQSDRLTRLINELLDVSRMHSGTLPLYQQPFDLSTLVYEVVSNLQLTAPEWTLDLDLAPAAPVYADRQRLEQVVLNLVQNAIKYSGASRRVEVTVTCSPAEVRVSVRDYGVGIPEAQQAFVFERFFRASNVDSRHYSGLGLGLFISHGIITRHGGRMWVESTEGVGSTFFFTLPPADERNEE